MSSTRPYFERNALLNEVIRGKYEEQERGWSTLAVRNGGVSFVVGNGQRLNFGKTLGLELPPYMSLIPTFMLWQPQRRLG